MRGLRTPMLRASVQALGCAAAVLAIGAAQGSADDSIPRPPGAIDHRGYELITPDKNRAQADQGAMLSADGSRVMWRMRGAFPGASSGARPIVLSTRTEKGWTSKAVLPPRDQLLGGSYMATLASPDFGSIIASAFWGFGGGNTATDESIVRLDDEGNQTLLHTFPKYFGPSGIEGVASDDLARLFTNAPEPIDPSHVDGTFNVYRFGDSATPVLVSRMPGGAGQAPACGVPTPSGGPSGFADSFGSVTQHWVSTDGSHAFFETRGDTCSDPLELYLRDIDVGTTIKISGPVVGGDPDNGADTFLAASGDASIAFYKSATSLDPADDTDADANDMDIYRWTASGGNECITCSVPNANVEPPLFFPGNAVVSRDLSHVYFASEGQFGGAPTPGGFIDPNLYVWHDGTIEFVAPSNGIAARSVDATELTPDGNVIVFPSFNPALDAITGRSNGGFLQFYRYDDRTGDLSCISCPSNGPATSDVPPVLATGTQAVQADVGAMTDDGSMVFFSTSDSLVNADVNRGPDLYEWHNGQRGLITTGRTLYPRFDGPSIAMVSADGQSLLFDDTEQLTSDATDSARKIYLARVNGGFAPAKGAAPPCQGDQCRLGGPTAPLALQDPSSTSITGAHNVRSSRPPSFKVGRITAAQRVRLARKGRLTLSVRVSRAGRISARLSARLGRHVRTVAHASHAARGAGVAKLPLRLSEQARSQLASTGRLTLTLEVHVSGSAVRRITLSLMAIPGGADATRIARVSATGYGR